MEVCGMTEGMFKAVGGGNHGQVEIPHAYLESVPFLLPVRVIVFTPHCVAQLA